jgi:hypothetical protein
VVTFLEDALRILTQWSDQLVYLHDYRHSKLVFVFVLLCVVWFLGLEGELGGDKRRTIDICKQALLQEKKHWIHTDGPMANQLPSQSPAASPTSSSSST